MGTYLSTNEIFNRLFKAAQGPEEAMPPAMPSDNKEETPAEPPMGDAPAEPPMPEGPGSEAPPAAPEPSQDEQIASLKSTLIELIGEEPEEEAANDDGALLSPDDPWYELQQEGLSKVSPEEHQQMMYPDAPPVPQANQPVERHMPSKEEEENWKIGYAIMRDIEAYQKNKLPYQQALELYRALGSIDQRGIPLVMEIIRSSWERDLEGWDVETIPQFAEKLAELYSQLADALQSPDAFPKEEEDDDLFG